MFSYTDVAIDAVGGVAWTAETMTPGVITFTTGTGTVDGPSSLTVLLTGIISNEVTAQQGDIFTNSLLLANHVDGQYYFYTDTVSAAVKEPILGIGKAVAPPERCAGRFHGHLHAADHPRGRQRCHGLQRGDHRCRTAGARL